MSADPRVAWRRFRRRPASTQWRLTALVLGVVGGLVAWVAIAPSATEVRADGAAAGIVAPRHLTSVDRASTAAPGVTKDSIKVVFPTVSLNSIAGQQGFARDIEYGMQSKAIQVFVDDINAHGGIGGRKIVPEIDVFDPTDPAGMRALCKNWTQSSDPAFAVIDGLGAFEGDNQLCVTQEGHTPMLAQWSTVSDWTTAGAPYLWWTGIDQSVLLDTLVSWGLHAKLLGAGHTVGIIAGDRAADQLALQQALLPALKAAGIDHPEVATIAASPDAANATVASDAAIIVQRFRDAGVDSVIPLIPFNAFFPYIQAETQQEWYPKLLLSDYESSIQIGLGLIPDPYGKALEEQQGVTAITLGGIDDDRPEDQGGYDDGVRACYDTWRKAVKPPPPPASPYLEEQGPVVAWCGAIRLFAAAARDAGPNPDRRTFVQAMSRIRNFPGTWSPTLSYGPDKFYGPTQYQVVKIHNNDPPSSQCILKYDHNPQGTCWVVTQGWRPVTTTSSQIGSK
jgi:Periplasmic binding protein